jgi:phosphate transport system substrate-binding protein
LTIRISKTAGLAGVVVLILIAALVAWGIRERNGSQLALGNNSVEAKELPATSPAPVLNKSDGADANSVSAQTPNTEDAIPQPPEPQTASQPQNEAAYPSSAPSQPEENTVEGPQRLIILREPPLSDSSNAQPETKPEDPQPQPADPPSQPPSSSGTVDPKPSRPARPSLFLNGAGATFPYPLYSKWFSAYDHLNPGIQFNYQSIGSGAGLRQVVEGTVDFGATDVPALGQQTQNPRIPLAYIPTVLGAIVPVCNVPGVSRELRFTPAILAGIFLGKIVSWNDPAIANANPSVYLPDAPIVVVHRADGNAATFILTDYLSKVSPVWQEKVGNGTSVAWPVGLGAKGNEGVAQLIRQTRGSIGYVDLLYAEQNHLPFGTVRNSTGKFVKASLASVTEAAAAVTELPVNSGISITNAPGKDAYPLASFTWLLIPQRPNDRTKGEELVAFLYWVLDNGEPMAGSLGYAPLPQKVAVQVRKIVEKLR